jgi:hypothetical protein
MPLYRSGFSYTPEDLGQAYRRLAGALEGCRQRMSVVAWPTRPSRRVLLITGFDNVVPVAGTVDAAVERLGVGAPAAPA